LHIRRAAPRFSLAALLPRPEAHGGSGQGLALHSTLLAVVGGTLAVESLPGAYTRILLTLPPAAGQDEPLAQGGVGA